MGGWFKREGIYVYIWLVHNVGKQKLAQQCKAIIQSLNHVPLFVTPWTAACQASWAFTVSRSLLKLMSIESVMPSNHLLLCCPLLLPSVFPSIRVFSNDSAPKSVTFFPVGVPTSSHELPTLCWMPPHPPDLKSGCCPHLYP